MYISAEGNAQLIHNTTCYLGEPCGNSDFVNLECVDLYKMILFLDIICIFNLVIEGFDLRYVSSVRH